MRDSEFTALLTLITDPDEYVSSKARERLISEFDKVEQKIYEYLSKSENHRLAMALHSIIQEYYFNLVKENLNRWLQSEDNDLLQGIFLVSKLFDNKIDYRKIQNFFNNLRRKIFFDVKNLSAVEKLRLLNVLVFNEMKLRISESYDNISNFLINKVIDKKSGSFLIIVIIYKILAEKFDIPIEIIHLQEKLLIACSDGYRVSALPYKSSFWQNFIYLNPADRHSLFTYNEVRYSLGLQGYTNLQDFSIATNKDLLKLLIGKFIRFARFQNDTNTMNLLVQLHKILH